MTDSALPAPPVESGTAWPTVDATPLEYAGFGIRVAARIIDLVLIWVLAFVTNFIAGFVVALVFRLLRQPAQPVIARLSTAGVVAFVAALLAALAFSAVAEAIHGSTPGKMLLGITVLSESGGFCGWGAAISREAAYYIDSLFFGLVALASMQSTKPRQQRLGDRWAHTVVVYRRSLQPAQRRSGTRFAMAFLAAAAAYSAVTVAGILIRL
jgi:uncharacterized RDD family membrane protein YckC